MRAPLPLRGKMGVAWKDHELITARYFGTNRRNRGQDFGVSDVEVRASYAEWSAVSEFGAKALNPHNINGGVVVECKQGYNIRLPEYFQDIQ